MSIFSKLFKVFLAVVFLPLIPMIFLLGYYQLHLKDNILETHANLAEIVASSMGQHIEALTWRLAFAHQITTDLEKHQNPTFVLQEALAANPDFVMLAVLSKEGKEQYRAAMSAEVSRQLAPIDLRGDPSLASLTAQPHLLISSFDVVSGRPISEFLYPLANGDYLYGGSSDLIGRQALHAHYIEFDHPHTEERVHFEAPLYEDMAKAIESLK